jgi:thiol-disulfide isomerase/thioredoxin
MLLSSRRWWSGLLTGTLSLGVLVVSATAQETPPAAKPAPAVKEFDPSKLPESKNLEDLLAFIQQGEGWRPQFDNTRQGDKEYVEGKIKEIMAVRRNLVAVANQALALKPNAEQVEGLQTTKWMSLRFLAMRGDEAADKEFQTLIKELVALGKGPLYGEAKKFDLRNRLMGIVEKTSKEPIEQIQKEIQAMMDSKDSMLQGIDVAMSASQIAQMKGAYDVSKSFLTSIQAKLPHVDNAQAAKAFGEQVEADLKLLSLLGQPAELKAKKFDSSDFDLASLKGKVVLIDFWATWCGPCLAEHPNVEKNYERFKSKGFEVVGVSLDDDQEKLKEFLEKHKTAWITIFNPDENTRGFDDPLAAKFHVRGIPATYLIDQSGKIVHVNVRGERLGEILEQLLGK